MFVFAVDVEACGYTIVAGQGVWDMSTASSFAFLGEGYDVLVACLIEF
jgi:hypothetical protein